MATIIKDQADLMAHVGQHLGYSDYVTVTRTVVRDIHIVSLVAGVVAVATSVQRGRP